MALFSWLNPSTWGKAQQQRAVFSSADPRLAELFAGPATPAGVAVNEARALGCSTIWSAVRVISENAASLPIKVYETKPGGDRAVVTAHPLYSLLHDEPCPYIGALSWKEAFVAAAALRGNAYAEIERRAIDKQPVALWLIPTDNVQPYLGPDGKPRYKVYQPSGGSVDFDGSDILHLRGPSGDGVNGHDIVAKARNSFGLTIAAEQYGAAFFGNGARPGGVLVHPGRLSDDARLRMRKDWEKIHTGVDNSHRIAILEEGTTFSVMSVAPEEAQFIQTRQYQTSEIARWFNVPLSKLRDNTGQTYSSIEAENLAFYTETLRPWLIRLEQELTLKLIAPAERSRYYIEHNADAILRADIKTRHEIYALSINWGIRSPNECRAMENLPPVEGGYKILQPLNMQPINAPSGPSAPSSTPAAAPSATPPDASPPAAAGASN